MGSNPESAWPDLPFGYFYHSKVLALVLLCSLVHFKIFTFKFAGKETPTEETSFGSVVEYCMYDKE